MSATRNLMIEKRDLLFNAILQATHSAFTCSTLIDKVENPDSKDWTNHRLGILDWHAEIQLILKEIYECQRIHKTC